MPQEKKGKGVVGNVDKEDSRNAAQNEDNTSAGSHTSYFEGDDTFFLEQHKKSVTSSKLSASSWLSLRRRLSVLAGEATIERSTQPSYSEADYLGASPQDNEGYRLLELLKNSEYFQTLPEKNKRAIIREQERKAGKIHALDSLIAQKNANKGDELDPLESTEELHTDRKQREQDEEQYRLRYLWKKRSPRTNWTLLILFHVVVLINFMICLFESYRITLEHGKFDRLFLNDDFNCMEVILSGDAYNHVFTLFHALTCVAVLFTDALETAKLCWGMIVAQILHLMVDTFQYLYNIRFPTEDKTLDSAYTIFLFILYTFFMIFSTAIILQRYYDMTNILQKRAQRYTASIYSGRPLNEHIIYKNESNFMQKKYTLRQAQQLLIYGIVQKIQHYKTRGLVMDKNELDLDVKAACAALEDLKDYSGPNVLMELRKLNEKRLSELQHNARKPTDAP